MVETPHSTLTDENIPQNIAASRFTSLNATMIRQQPFARPDIVLSTFASIKSSVVEHAIFFLPISATTQGARHATDTACRRETVRTVGRQLSVRNRMREGHTSAAFHGHNQHKRPASCPSQPGRAGGACAYAAATEKLKESHRRLPHVSRPSELHAPAATYSEREQCLPLNGAGNRRQGPATQQKGGRIYRDRT